MSLLSCGNGSSKVTAVTNCFIIKSVISQSRHIMTLSSHKANHSLSYWCVLFQGVGGGWIEAQNSRGEVGLVPEDYIEVREWLEVLLMELASFTLYINVLFLLIYCFTVFFNLLCIISFSFFTSCIHLVA